MRRLGLGILLGLCCGGAVEAACVFYHQDGTLYGVHPTCDVAETDIHLPEDVRGLEVTSLAWPSTSDGREGRERWTRVNPATETLEVDESKVTAPDPDAELEAAIRSAATLQELKDALLGNLRQGRVKARRP